MRCSAGFLFMPFIGLAACGQATGSVPDVSSDVHCSVITYYFSSFADQSGAPADQRHATAAITEWYAVRIRELAARRGETNSLTEEAQPILDAVRRDPRAMLDEFQACSDRALADPAFNAFASSLR